MHGWQVSDLNCYFVEVPLLALSEAVFGLGDFAQHVASALTYALVALMAIAVAVAGSRGTARAVRSGAVLAVLAAPLFAGTMFVVVEEPDHIGTTILILGSFLVIDRLLDRRYTAPLLLVILTLAQFDDLTVRYAAVPAIVLICGYHAIVALVTGDRSAGARPALLGTLRSPDALAVYAALVSVLLSDLFSKVWVHFGGFVTPPLWQSLSPMHEWIHHVRFVWESLLTLYGAHAISNIAPGPKAYFGIACLAAAIIGFARVVFRWRKANRVEQMIVIAVVFNLAAFLVTGFSTVNNPHELALLLPGGAVLAARTFVPATIKAATRAYAALAAVAVIAAVPLAYSAAKPNFQPQKAPLVAFLEAHHLTYGLGSYDSGATATVLSHGQAQVVPVHPGFKTVAPYTFESNKLWYTASQHDATFAVADKIVPASLFIHQFGKPVATYHVDSWTVLVYDRNLLRDLSRH
jgi:hypothetical protein